MRVAALIALAAFGWLFYKALYGDTNHWRWYEEAVTFDRGHGLGDSDGDDWDFDVGWSSE